MAFDGILIHHLVSELNNNLSNGRINKIIQPNPTDIILQIHNHHTYNFLISMSYNNPRFYLINEKPQSPLNPYNFCMVLRKYLERGIIKEIIQIENDRIVIVKIENKNELGDTIIYNLIIELMGRSSNLILTLPNYQILDVMRKHFPSDDTTRIMIPKATYQFPDTRGLLNPFTNDIDIEDINLVEGASKIHKEEIKTIGSVEKFIKQNLCPTIYFLDKKQIFSPYNLYSINAPKKSFNTISELLNEQFKENVKADNPDFHRIQKLLKNKINLLTSKITNLEGDLESSKSHADDLIKGQLLQSSLYNIKKGTTTITLRSFDDTEDYTITLNPLKTPTENMQMYFKNYKKSINAEKHINEQIEIAKNEIIYLNTILSQIEFVNTVEMNDIKAELIANNYLKENKKITKTKQNSIKNITKYSIEGSEFFVGKNNLQNNYLTHSFAKNNDYWFHVKDMPSAHVILRTNQLEERNIRIAAHLAGLNSKYDKSNSVPIDYTEVKNIKKVPGMKGCFVTYTNQKTIYIDPSFDDLKNLLNPSDK